VPRRRDPARPLARTGAWLLACLVLLGGALSSHGYLLVPPCESAGASECHLAHPGCQEPAAPRAETCACAAACSDRASAAREPSEDPHEPCSDCRRPCCFAVSVALAAGASPALAPPRTRVAVASPRLAPRRVAGAPFRPPLA